MHHAAGNYRVLTTMSAQLLSAAVQRQAAMLDEKLYFEVFADTKSASAAKPRHRAGGEAMDGKRSINPVWNRGGMLRMMVST